MSFILVILSTGVGLATAFLPFITLFLSGLAGATGSTLGTSDFEILSAAMVGPLLFMLVFAVKIDCGTLIFN